MFNSLKLNKTSAFPLPINVTKNGRSATVYLNSDGSMTGQKKDFVEVVNLFENDEDHMALFVAWTIAREITKEQEDGSV